MTNFPRFDCEEFLVQAYQEDQTLYGNLDLATDTYLAHLVSIIRKYLSYDPDEPDAMGFLGKTHTLDLYLAIACAQGIESAWEQFVRLYRSFVMRLANHACSNETVACELANNLIADLFACSSWLRIGRDRRLPAAMDKEYHCNPRVNLPGLIRLYD